MNDLEIDFRRTEKSIIHFLKKEFGKFNKKLAILGISGGVDSAVAAFLCRKSGLDLILISMPYGKFSDVEKSELVVRNIKTTKGSSIKFFKIDIAPSVNAQIKELQKKVSLDKIDKGNIMARQRMIIQYALARKFGGLVVGTENLSEYCLGYFTLHGDQACDINPISSLFKTQVLGLAKHLGLPEEIIKQKPSAGLYEGQTDESELGFSYFAADPILYLYCLKKISQERIIKDFRFKADLVCRVIKRVKDTEYKRKEVPKL